jgi:hypothetical protein
VGWGNDRLEAYPTVGRRIVWRSRLVSRRFFRAEAVSDSFRFCGSVAFGFSMTGWKPIPQCCRNVGPLGPEGEWIRLGGWRIRNFDVQGSMGIRCREWVTRRRESAKERSQNVIDAS